MLWPREFVIIETVALLGFVFVCAFFITFYINLVTETPAWHYLVSSAIVSVAAFWLPNIIGNFTLAPLRWFNGEPQDLRTAVWDHLIVICAVSAVLCYIGWQLMVHNRKCRFRI
jgi:hypothetical protein